tara:strand:- start:756 stop:1091 length:336 start_codon:yes stop_codon:yes gene_type:complete
MPTRLEYWAEISEIAAYVTEEARDEERDIHEVLHEQVDSHQFVIYTAQAQEVLAISDNDGAYVDNYGAEGVTKGGSLNWSALAYAAMEADVMAHDNFNADPEEEDDEALAA